MNNFACFSHLVLQHVQAVFLVVLQLPNGHALGALSPQAFPLLNAGNVLKRLLHLPRARHHLLCRYKNPHRLDRKHCGVACLGKICSLLR